MQILSTVLQIQLEITHGRKKKRDTRGPPENYQQIVSTMATEPDYKKADEESSNSMLNYQFSTSGHTEFIVMTKMQRSPQT